MKAAREMERKDPALEHAKDYIRTVREIEDAKREERRAIEKREEAETRLETVEAQLREAIGEGHEDRFFEHGNEILRAHSGKTGLQFSIHTIERTV